ncbi:MAG TPA: hypothetical protein VJT73_01855, partial [Polyangiaceae bacterium]|nr:hypothetical protein [Polyangiaceae bacterium]
AAATTGIGVAFLLLLATAGSAQAQSRFGDKGQLVITGENLFALSTEKLVQATGAGDQTLTSNRFGFLYSQGGGPVSPHGPQVGGHYFIIPQLSIGATIGYESRGGSLEAPVGGNVVVKRDTTDFSTFILMPKVGYALMFNNIIGFWFRGGVGYFRAGQSNPNDTNDRDSYSFLLLSADALFVVSPVPHFGFYVGPQADLAVTGSFSNRERNVESSWSAGYRSLGLGLGLLGHFDL